MTTKPKGVALKSSSTDLLSTQPSVDVTQDPRKSKFIICRPIPITGIGCYLRSNSELTPEKKNTELKISTEFRKMRNEKLLSRESENGYEACFDECQQLTPLALDYKKPPTMISEHFTSPHPKEDIKELKTSFDGNSQLTKSKEELTFNQKNYDKLELIKKSKTVYLEKSVTERRLYPAYQEKTEIDSNIVSCLGGEDHLTDIVPMNCQTLQTQETVTGKLKEEFDKYSQVFEADLARCDLSATDGSTVVTDRSTVLGIDVLPELESPQAVEKIVSQLEPFALNLSPKKQVVQLLSARSCLAANEGSDIVLSMTKRLNESYQMQERMAYENKNLEETKFQLQEELLSIEKERERLEKKVEILDAEMRVLRKENFCLMEKVNEGMNTLNNQSKDDVIMEDISWLQKELKCLKEELHLLKCEREEIMLTKVNAYRSLMNSPPTVEKDLTLKENMSSKTYESLQREFEAALEKICKIKEENDSLRIQLDNAKEKNGHLIEKDQEVEKIKAEVAHLKELCCEKDLQLKELNKQKEIIAQEVDDIRALFEDQTFEIQEYRNKYLQAQQRVEELIRDLHLKQAELESSRNNFKTELRSVRANYQDKLTNYEQMGTVLKDLEMRLQESQQQRLLLEQGLEEAKREMTLIGDTKQMLQKTLESERNSRTVDATERQRLERLVTELEEKHTEWRNEKAEMLAKVARMDETIRHFDQQYQEKTKEATEAARMLDEVRADATRQLSRSKERADNVRLNLQVKLADLERELAAARAAAKAAQRERDDVRQKLQSEINSLTETLEEGQSRWKGLQAHVTTLQNSLHPAVLPLVQRTSGPKPNQQVAQI